MSQTRLSSLALLPIEKCIAKRIDTSDIILTLANIKSRRMFQFYLLYKCTITI